MKKTIPIIALPFVFLTLNACVSLPDVYLIDRHTVMEAEASGEWPQIDQRVREQGVQPGPALLEKESDSQRKARTLKVLNGEFTTEIKPQ